MPRKKTDEIAVVTECEPAVLCEEKTGEFITLKKGASFTIGDYVFEKSKPVPVDSETADMLMKTGFFERNF